MVNNTTKTSPEDFLVTGLEEVEPAYAEFPGNMYAGLLSSDHHDRHGQMMFWLFEPDEQSTPDSIVLWLNGGPGCSSFNCGVLMEHSPVTQPQHPAGYCCLTSDPSFSYNKHTWTRATTMLYVEQPIGTGFSYGSPLPQNEHDVSADLHAFLLNFFQVFEHLANYDFYVMGESYAGMFVPSITHYIHLQNLKANHDNRIIHLKGAAIGNGWMDAYVQGPATIDYSWWHGIIDQPTRNALHQEFKDCLERKHRLIEPPPFHPFNVQDDCGIMWGVLLAAGNPNAYDITTWDPNVDQVTFTSEAFYNSEKVKKALHAPENITWHGCRQGEGRRRLSELRRLYMDNDRPISVVPYLAEVLDAGIPVVVYNGDRDMTTNMVGTELLLNDMEWSGKKKWMDAPRGLWMVDDYEAGWAKELDNLAFVVVYNSGHMVPYNQPEASFDLLKRLLNKSSFLDTELPTVRVMKKGGDTKTESTLFADELLPSNVGGTSHASMGYHSHSELLAVAVVSMLLGVVLTMLLSRRQRSLHGNYQRVPDANVSH